MSHTEENLHLSPEEAKYRDYITRGDDLCKIELFRLAVDWYKKAVELRPDDREAAERLAGCKKKVKAESRSIITILLVAAVIIMAVIAIKAL